MELDGRLGEVLGGEERTVSLEDGDGAGAIIIGSRGGEEGKHIGSIEEWQKKDVRRRKDEERTANACGTYESQWAPTMVTGSLRAASEEGRILTIWVDTDTQKILQLSE